MEPISVIGLPKETTAEKADHVRLHRLPAIDDDVASFFYTDGCYVTSNPDGSRTFHPFHDLKPTLGDRFRDLRWRIQDALSR